MKTIIEKLLKIQAELKPIVKDETNPFFKSKYYDINGLLEMLRPLLVKHSLLLLQPMLTDSSGKTSIETILIDDSGEKLSWITLLPENTDIQKQGAIITYMRRYILTSLFALESEDDDGESAKTLHQDAPKKVFHMTPNQAQAPKCEKCGADTKWSAKSGKFYCADLCWTKVEKKRKEMKDQIDMEIPF